MAERPKKILPPGVKRRITSERGVKRPSKAEREAAKALTSAKGLAEAKAEIKRTLLPESLIPVRHTAMHGLELPYEKLTMILSWEVEQNGGCLLDAAVACYALFRSICVQQGVPPHTAFGDFDAMANEGALKHYMREHTRRCPHTKPTPPTPPIR